MRVVRVLPDVSGLNKVFDYFVPDDLGGPPIAVGSLVRVQLHNRRTAGWVVAVDVDPPAGVKLEPLLKSSSVGPTEDVVELAQWVSHEWAGRWAAVLKTASPEPFVRSLPRPASVSIAGGPTDGLEVLFDGAGPRVVRSAPASDRFEILRTAAARGPTLVVTPDQKAAAAFAGRLSRTGVRTHRYPKQWAGGFEGGVVLGARSAVFASVPGLRSIVVLDEHDDALQNERNPTWHARDVAIERARRANIPCLLVSASPSPAALAATEDVRLPNRTAERSGWPVVQVIDRRDDEPGRTGLFSGPLIRRLRESGRAVCILNRKGRAVMLACATCGELVRSTSGDELMIEDDAGLLALRSGETRPRICLACSGTKLKRLRLGVSRAAEELSTLLREPVGEVVGTTAAGEGLEHRVMVGTEALLHRIGAVDTVAFLDFDNEVLAARYRAAEQSMTLLARAAALVGPRTGGGRVLVQTRVPDHRVLRAASRAQPELFTAEELELRQMSDMPPYRGLAMVSGAGAASFTEPLGARLDVDVIGPDRDGRFLVKGSDRRAVSEALSDLTRPKEGRVSIAVDPPRA